MKLAFSTLLCHDMNTQDVLSMCQTSLIRNIELREGKPGMIHLDASLDERNLLIAQLNKASVNITNLGTSICASGHSEASTLQNIEETSKALSLIEDLNIPAIRVFLGNFAFHYKDPKPLIHYELIVEYLKTACKMAAKSHKEIWIETHNEFSTGMVLNRLLHDVNAFNLGVIWDVIHPLERNESIENTMLYLGSSCKHIHIKDGQPHQDPSMCDWAYTPIGQGNIPIPSIINLLENHNFKGYFSLEWESKWRKELQEIPDSPLEILNKYRNYMHNIKD